MWGFTLPFWYPGRLCCIWMCARWDLSPVRGWPGWGLLILSCWWFIILLNKTYCLLGISSPSFLRSLPIPIPTLWSEVKVLVPQSCLTLCDPVDYSLPGSSVRGESPGKNTGVGSHALLHGIFLTKGLNPCLLLSPALTGGPLDYLGSPWIE